MELSLIGETKEHPGKTGSYFLRMGVSFSDISLVRDWFMIEFPKTRNCCWCFSRSQPKNSARFSRKTGYLPLTPMIFQKKNGVFAKISGVIKNYQPKQCTIKGEILQIYHTFVVFSFPPKFDPWKIFTISLLHLRFVLFDVPWRQNQHQMVLKSIMPMYLCMYKHFGHLFYTHEN